jgi:ADP-dependent NAD(P)H-hydrate dehydratase / NAD(P)H-hydrate epimerase
MPIAIIHDISWPLHSIAATRDVEYALAAQLAPNTLMQRAGLAVAQLACALAPHARSIWIACGPGNNGGDGLEAALHLQRWGRSPVVTLCGDPAQLPVDAAAALARALAAGVVIAAQPPAQCDLAIDALLGIGSTRPLASPMREWLLHLHASAGVVLSVDVPSGLNADTGCYADTHFAADLIAARAGSTGVIGLFCLNLLTIKPGVFTAQGKDTAGQVWWDGLDAGPSALTSALHSAQPNAPNTAPASTPAHTSLSAATATLLGADRVSPPLRPHASHKGSYGDVAVIGGAQGMTGAALLAARAALHSGAGRVFVALLDGGSMQVDSAQPELMFRQPSDIALRDTTVVCGCGGGDTVRSVLPRILSSAQRLVLDADALNAVAADTNLQRLLVARAARGAEGVVTVITPHPLEAARLLGCSAAQVQADRLQAAKQLADKFACTVVLKGAGSIIAAPGLLPFINPTGNAKLATAGTGDVLAGMVGAALATGRGSMAADTSDQTAGLLNGYAAACTAVYHHGLAASLWPDTQHLTASTLLNI